VIATNASWDAKNSALWKKPIYVFTVAGETTVYTTHDLAREGVTGSLPPYEPWLKTPQGASQSIDIINGTSSIGELLCEVIEQGGAVRTLVSTADPPVEGRAIVLSVGYPGIPYADFVPLQTYQLYKVVPSKGYTSWLFHSRDPQVVAKRTLYTNPINGAAISESNPWIVQGTPAEITQAVYLFALGRSEDEIDRDRMQQIDSGAEGLFKTVRPFLFVINQPYEAKQFLESEIYKPCGLYPVIDNLGQLSLRPFRAPAAGPTAAYAFNEDNIVVLPEFDRQEVLNSIVFNLDYNGSEYKSELVYVDAESVSLYGRGQQLAIQSQGLRTVLGAQWFCEEMARRMFRRFGGTIAGLRGGAAKITVEAMLMTLPAWVGDYVSVTHRLVPDVATGNLGVTNRLYEVIDREPDYARGRMRYVLLDTGLTGLAAAHNFAPSARDFLIEGVGSALY